MPEERYDLSSDPVERTAQFAIFERHRTAPETKTRTPSNPWTQQRLETDSALAISDETGSALPVSSEVEQKHFRPGASNPANLAKLHAAMAEVSPRQQPFAHQLLHDEHDDVCTAADCPYGSDDHADMDPTVSAVPNPDAFKRASSVRDMRPPHNPNSGERREYAFSRSERAMRALMHDIGVAVRQYGGE